MIGIVLVSHSAPLANATLELALQMVPGTPPPLRVAAGADGTFGTDAAAIAQAIDELSDADGVLVITDLGSATMSSTLAVDLRSSTVPVIISDGPFVEATTAAVVASVGGAPLAAVAAEAHDALRAKRSAGAEHADIHAVATSEEPPPAKSATAQEWDETVRNPMGLHARPAATLVRTVTAFDADVELTNRTRGHGPVKATSLVSLLSLALVGGDVVHVHASGPQAAEASAAIRALFLDGFGEHGDEQP